MPSLHRGRSLTVTATPYATKHNAEFTGDKPKWKTADATLPLVSGPELNDYAPKDSPQFTGTRPTHNGVDLTLPGDVITDAQFSGTRPTFNDGTETVDLTLPGDLSSLATKNDAQFTGNVPTHNQTPLALSSDLSSLATKDDAQFTGNVPTHDGTPLALSHNAEFTGTIKLNNEDVIDSMTISTTYAKLTDTEFNGARPTWYGWDGIPEWVMTHHNDDYDGTAGTDTKYGLGFKALYWATHSTDNTSGQYSHPTIDVTHHEGVRTRLNIFGNGIAFRSSGEWMRFDDAPVWISGDLYINNGFWITSDDRLKSREQRITGALETMKSVTGKKYEHHPTHSVPADDEDSDLTDVEHSTRTGVIAQELQGIPELAHLVHEGESLSVDYLGLIPYLIEAVKELAEEVERLKK